MLGFIVTGIAASIAALIARTRGRNFFRWWIYSFISIFMIWHIAGALIVLYALQDAIVMFYTPSDLLANQINPGQRFRLGGLVVAGSITRNRDMRVEFAVTDKIKDLKVSYGGILPDLFREEECVMAEGDLGPTFTFVADTVVVMRDETHFPPDVAKALKQKGFCQE